MSFLQGLGAVAGGLDSTLGPLLQQYQQNVATGQGIAAMYGGMPQQQQQGGALGSILQGVSGGSAPPNVDVQAPPMMGQGGGAPPMSPVPAPSSFGQGGNVRSMPQPSAAPMPQPSAAPMPQMAQQQTPTVPMPPQSQPAPLPRGQPMNPSGGQAPGFLQQQQVAQQAAQQQQAAQMSPQLQAQQQTQQKPPDLTPFNGQFDFNTLMHNLVKTPGMTYQKLGRIANSPAFERMLTQQGLNQYRMLNLGNQMERTGIMEDRLGQEASKFRTTTERLERDKINAQKQHALDKEEADLKFTYGQQNQRLLFGPSVGPDGKSIDKQAASQKLDDDLSKAMEDIKKRRAAFEEEASGSGESSGGGDSGGPDVIYDNKSGKEYRYKGSGDRSDIKNYAPVQ